MFGGFITFHNFEKHSYSRRFIKKNFFNVRRFYDSSKSIENIPYLGGFSRKSFLMFGGFITLSHKGEVRGCGAETFQMFGSFLKFYVSDESTQLELYL